MKEHLHKYKIHETYFSQRATTGAYIEKRAVIVCEKCGQVADKRVEIF